MNRRRILAFGSLLALAPSLALAQKRVPRIGYLLLSPLRDAPSRERVAFLEGLREHGYVVGRNVDIAYASAESQVEFLEDACRELLRKGIDVIATAGAEATLTAAAASKTIPVVFLALGDPVGLGAVRSLGRPGGNVTGVSFLSNQLAGKRLEFLREAAPRAKSLAVLWDQDNSNARIEGDAAMEAAPKLSLTVRAVPLQRESVGTTLAALGTRRPDALYVCFGQGAVAENRTAIAEFGLHHRIPVVSGWSFMTEGGALLSYAPDIPSMFRRGAYYVARVLGGANPADLPVEQARAIELAINLRTAKAIGLTLPRSLLLRADRIIE